MPHNDNKGGADEANGALSHWAVPTDVSVSIGSQVSRLSATTYSNFAPGEDTNHGILTV
jgi:hypothetical protein